MKKRGMSKKEIFENLLIEMPNLFIMKETLDSSNFDDMMFKIIKTKVDRVHKNKITEVKIKNNGKERVMYQTVVNKNYRPRCTTIELLYDKLYAYYYGNEPILEADLESEDSFRKVFEKALDERIRTRWIAEKTVRHYKSDFNALISEDFAKKDITTIKRSDIEAYIQEVIHKKDMSEKRLKTLKGLFNLVFEYGTNPEHKIVQENPVPKHNQIFKARKVSKKPKDKAFQPDEVEKLKAYFWERARNLKYDVHSFCVLFACETGVRVGEIPSLMWSDIDFNSMTIHIHSQQNDHRVDGKRIYYYNPATKNEKGVSMDGRYFPLTDNIIKILKVLKEKQKENNIRSKWVFAKKDGDWTTSNGYEYCLNTGCKNLGLSLSNNHAIRMYLNSYVFIPKGIEVADRAQLLGHSVEVNLKYYTFAEDNLDKFRNLLNMSDNTFCNTLIS